MSTTHPVGLTVAELRQRAWIEGDLRTAALLGLQPQAKDVDDRDELSLALHKSGQQNLMLERT